MNPLVIEGTPLIPWEHRTREGLTLRGYETPFRKKPLVHFIHGNGFSVLSYLPLLRRLIPHVDLVLTHAQGHGGSDPGSRFDGWNHNMALIYEVLLHKRADWQARGVPVIGMGHSFGAVLTTLMTRQPVQIFDRLLLLDPVYLPLPYAIAAWTLYPLGAMHHTPIARRTRSRRSHWPDRDSAWKYLYQRGVFKGWDDEALQAYVDHALEERPDGLHLMTPPWLEVEIFARVPKGLWPAVRELKIPAHVLLGEDTYGFAKAGLKKACKLNPRVTQQTMPGGHCFMQQFPQQTAEQILQQLQSWKS